MKINATRAACATAVALFAAPSLLGWGIASAHHSSAMYDATKTVTLRGTLKRFQISNPHSWFWLKVSEPGGDPDGDIWALEGNGVSDLLKRWGPDVTSQLRIGEPITITIHPLRDGRKSGQVIGIVLANGKVLK
ncbi:MAG: DUF6152 family protein [Gammaproteobacteria bacterium]